MFSLQKNEQDYFQETCFISSRQIKQSFKMLLPNTMYILLRKLEHVNMETQLSYK